jgi:3'-5' exoribonuclease
MISKGRFISEIGDGDRVKAIFLISKRWLLTTRNGKPYAKLMLSDKTGEILGIIWDDASQKISGIELGDIVGIKASAESYENRLQLRVEDIRRFEEKDVDMSGLIPTTSRDMVSMMEEFDRIVLSLKNNHLKLLIERIFGREGLRDAFMKAPAAKGIHHNYIGGLLEHTLTILKAIEALLPVYIHVELNRDMLIIGAILHDMGKIQEYSYNKVIDITPIGRLLGHIYLSAQMVDHEAAKIDNFPEELRLQLLHMILGHHGHLEFGSPKLPMTREAIFLHMLDDLDAKLIGFSSIIDSTPEEEAFSPYSSVYERHLYTRIYQEEEES